ncbi:MAG: VTT domain-containing protein [Proteobacteria bacterium]|nr:VTT domain-containing protein [Pseudomonadota bacterium]
MIIGLKAKECDKPCHSDRLKPALKKKGVALFVMLGVALFATLLVYKYFYFLDAYFYTYEFYWLFNVKNLQAADSAMFADYFRSMGVATEALPQMVLSHLIQNFYLPFSKPILVSAITSAFGLGLGSFFSYAAFVVTGIFSFGVGTFFLGDIVLYLQDGKLEEYQKNIATPAALIALILFAVPVVPISFVAIGVAALKVPFWRTSQCMLMGFSVRLALLLGTPFLFL